MIQKTKYIILFILLFGCKVQEPKVLTEEKLMRMDKKTFFKFMTDRTYVLGYDKMFSDFNVSGKKGNERFYAFNLKFKSKQDLAEVVLQEEFKEYFFKPQPVKSFRPQPIDVFQNGYEVSDTVYHTPHSFIRQQIIDTLNYYIIEDSIRNQVIAESKKYIHIVDTVFSKLYGVDKDNVLYEDRRGRYWKFAY